MGGDCDCPWRLDYRPQGLAGPRKRIEFPTKKAAEKHLAAMATKVARGEYISPEKIPTFAKAGEEWLRDKADRHPATVQGWRVHLKHLVKLDNVRLDRIDDETNESEKGLRTVRPDEVLSADEIKKLLGHAAPGLYRTLFATVAATGMRPEEVYDLKWTDVSLDAAQISVRRSLSWSRRLEEKGRVRPKLYEPKTRSGYRTLPLPAALVTMLKVWKLQSPQSEHDLVFCRLDGQPLHRSNVLRQGLYPALRRAELRSANVKTLRHSYANGLIAAGAYHRSSTPAGAFEPGRHLKVYSHWFKDADTGAVDRFAQGFLANPRKSGQKVGTESGRKHQSRSVALVTT
jgi:integrase